MSPLGPITRAPWTKEQVAALAAHQARNDVHPYTCPGDRSDCASRRNLVPTPDGWVCQCGRYTQDWAHGIVAKGQVFVEFPPSKSRRRL